MTPRQQQRLSSVMSMVGECLASGMTASEAAVLVDPEDTRQLDAKTRAALEKTLASDAFVPELPLVLAAAVGPRCEAWVRSAGDTARQGEALGVIADELWRPRRVSAVFTLILADLIVLGVVGLIFAFFIAPTWHELLEGVGAVLPMPTRLAILLGEAISVIIIVGVLAVVVYRVSARVRPSGPFVARLHRAVRRLPVMSKYLRLRQSVGLAQWLAVGNPDALPTVRSMAEAGRPMSLGPVARELEHRLEKGMRLSEAMDETGAFQPGFAKIVRRLEESADASTRRVLLARYVVANAGREGPALDRLVIATHFVTAVIVCIFVIGLYMPIFKLGSVI